MDLRNFYARPSIITATPTYLVHPLNIPYTERLRIMNTNRFNVHCKVKIFGDQRLVSSVASFVLGPGRTRELAFTLGVDDRRSIGHEMNAKLSFLIDTSNRRSDVNNYFASTDWLIKTVYCKRWRFTTDALMVQHAKDGLGIRVPAVDNGHSESKRKVRETDNATIVLGHKVMSIDEAGKQHRLFLCHKCTADSYMSAVDFGYHLEKCHEKCSLAKEQLTLRCEGETDKCKETVTYRHKATVHETICNAGYYIECNHLRMKEIAGINPKAAFLVMVHLKEVYSPEKFEPFEILYKDTLEELRKELVERLFVLDQMHNIYCGDEKNELLLEVAASDGAKGELNHETVDSQEIKESPTDQVEKTNTSRHETVDSHEIKENKS